MHNLNNLSWWTTKHYGYAIREAIDLLDIELNLWGKTQTNELTGQAAAIPMFVLSIPAI
jgi:hypothetical protein